MAITLKILNQKPSLQYEKYGQDLNKICASNKFNVTLNNFKHPIQCFIQ